MQTMNVHNVITVLSAMLLLTLHAACQAKPEPQLKKSGKGTNEMATAAAQGSSTLEQLLDVLSTGDQAAYERFVKQEYSSKALSEYSAEQHAAALARIYTETAGFRLERVVVESNLSVIGEARDQILDTPYCVTLTRSTENGRERITDFEAQAIYAAGPELATPSPSELAAKIDRAAGKYARRKLFSGVILLAKDDQIILEKAYGEASLAYNVPMTPTTRLNIASIGKVITGVAIAQLVAARKLTYDDSVGAVLPDFPNPAVRQRITVRQLLTHTSGLGPKDYYQDASWQGARSRLRSVADYMKLIADVQIGETPGKYHYSNAGYVILGAIIERLTGVSYYDYVREHIFKPAGMTHSFYHEMDQEDQDVAVPLTNLFNHGDEYLYRLGQPRSAIYELAAKGGPHGGAYVTARDLLAFQKALRDGILVTPSLIKEMTAPQGSTGAGAPGLTGDAREGLGVEVVTRNGHRFFGHTGGDLGIASLLYWYPDTGYTTIILSNRDPRAARVLANLTRGLITRKTINGAAPPKPVCAMSGN